MQSVSDQDRFPPGMLAWGVRAIVASALEMNQFVDIIPRPSRQGAACKKKHRCLILWYQHFIVHIERMNEETVCDVVGDGSPRMCRTRPEMDK